MISMDKKYRTRDGRQVRIYAVGCGGEYCVHGAIKLQAYWTVAAWHEDGTVMGKAFENIDDLIEIKPSAIEQMVNRIEERMKRPGICFSDMNLLQLLVKDARELRDAELAAEKEQP